MISKSSSPSYKSTIIHSPTIELFLLAAGLGQRMNYGQNKLCIPFQGETLFSFGLRKCLDACAISGSFIQRIHLVGREAELRPLIQPIFETHSEAEKLSSQILSGGSTRQESVFRALTQRNQYSSPPNFVFIHDAARPLLSAELLQRARSTLPEHFASIPVLPSVDTLRMQLEGTSEQLQTLDRARIFRVQTPQVFSFHMLLDLHQEANINGIQVTDDAELFLQKGLPVHCFEGEEKCFKITHPEDLIRLKAYL